MTRRKRRLKQTQSFIATGAMMGIGAHVIGKADPTGVAAPAATGIGKMAAFMPVTGTVMGAGWAMDELKRMQPKKRKKRKRW